MAQRAVASLLVAVLLTVVSLSVPVEAAKNPIGLEGLADFILDVGESYPVALNETVAVAVNAFLDKLQCVQQGLSHMECVQCLKPSMVAKMISTTPESNISSISDIEKLSVVLINHALTFRYSCRQRKDSKTSVEACASYPVCKRQLKKALPLDDGVANDPELLLEVVENVLREIKGFYEPRPFQKCFSAEIILSELYPNNEEIPTLQKLSTRILGHMLKGECVDVGEAVTDFLDDIFLHYGDRCNGIITPTAFEKLMSDLRTQRQEEHETHGTTKSLCTNDVETERGWTTQRSHSPVQYDLDGIAKEERKKNVYTAKDVLKRIERGTSPHTMNVEHQHKSLASECLSAEGLLRKFTSSNVNITPSHFFQLCPALVQQVVSGVCHDVNATKLSAEIIKPSSAEVYGYGTLAVLLISLTSLCGVVLIPILEKSAYRYTMLIFIGISFGTMAGDAILHLIPQALGLHGHEEKSDDGDEEHEGVTWDNIPEYIGIQIAALAFMYLLFIFESTSSYLKGDEGGESGHGHSHAPEKLPDNLPMRRVDASTNGEESGPDGANNEGHRPEVVNEPIIKSTNLLFGFTTMAITIIIGDVLHNFGDGLAIGASFAPGLSGGLSTSFAVLCHELPHEFGDFVVLLSTGLTFRKALLANFLSAMTSFLGLYTGIVVGDNLTARKWIMSATAGVFLYVALSEMLPELKHYKKGDSFSIYVVKHIGILVGFGLMILIAIYEDHFHL